MCKAQYCNMPARNGLMGYCPACYRYFRLLKGVQYTPAEVGKVAVTPDGKIICHICRQAYDKLGSHIYNKHGIATKLYKEYFKLNHNTNLTNATYHIKMREYTTKNYDLVVTENLTHKGENTRIKSGDKLRKNITHHKVKKYISYN